MKKVALILLIAIMLSMIVSCTIPEESDISSNGTSSDKEISENSNDSSAESEISEDSDDETSDDDKSNNTNSEISEDNKIGLSEDDTLLMTITIDGSERSICLNKKLDNPGKFDDETGEFQTFDFAILTKDSTGNDPTLVRAGDTYMGFKIEEVSAKFFCYGEKMYPSPVMTVKMSSEDIGDGVLKYGHLDSEEDIYLLLKPSIALFYNLPYPLYSMWNYSLDLYVQKKLTSEIVIENLKETVEEYDLTIGARQYHSHYPCYVTFSEVIINFDQPGASHYYSAVIDELSFIKGSIDW